MISYVYDLLRATTHTGNIYTILIFSFFAGVVTSFTPCVYPMIPVTMGILQTNATVSLWANFLSALCYVFGMAVVYATLGYIAATGSLIFGQWAASPWFIGFIVAFFLYLAFSMFGFYELHLPQFLVRRTEAAPVRHHPLIKNFLLGIVTGTVASPCLTPPLAMLLALAAKTANPLVGLGALFMFSFGIGMLLLVVGTFSSSLSLLPRAGMWLDGVKKFFGFVMLAMTVYFAQPLLPGWVLSYLYLGIAGIAVVYYTINWIVRR